WRSRASWGSMSERRPSLLRLHDVKFIFSRSIERQRIVLEPFGRCLTHGHATAVAVAVALAQELDSAGGQLVAGPVLAVVSGPDARHLHPVARLTAQLALDVHLHALRQVLVDGFRQLAPGRH